MKELESVDKKRLMEVFNLKESELFEAEYNLLGFFETLYEIDERLNKEEKQKQGVKDD